METPHLKTAKNQDSTSLLFRKLFLLSIELENHKKMESTFKAEIINVSLSIDELMEVILQR